jgi:transmembrane sensor
VSNIYEMPNREKRFDEASQWIAKLDQGLTKQDARELQQWMAASRANYDTLIQMATLWDKMDVMSRLSDLFPKPVQETPKTKPRSYPLALAASFLIAVGFSVWLGSGWLPTAESTVMSDTYETAVGESSTVSLPDGTVLVLNTNSLVRVNYTAAYRLFDLQRGEIHVEVAHNNQRPLRVAAGDRMVQAVGTAFNVQLYQDKRIKLIVTDGKVLVSNWALPEQSQSEFDDPRFLAGDTVAVSKGEKLLLSDNATPTIEKLEPEDIAVGLAWRSGNLIFRGEPLAEAIAEISRYTSVEFKILDDQLNSIRVAGVFKAGDVNGLLVTLNDHFNIVHERVGKDTILLKAR